MPNDDTVGKGGWGGENVSKSDDVILGRSLRRYPLPIQKYQCQNRGTSAPSTVPTIKYVYLAAYLPPAQPFDAQPAANYFNEEKLFVTHNSFLRYLH